MGTVEEKKTELKKSRASILERRSTVKDLAVRSYSSPNAVFWIWNNFFGSVSGFF